MKKLLAIIVCLGLMLSFVACDNDEQKVAAPKDDTQTSQNDSVESEIESAVEEVAKFARGKIVGNVYSSDYSGIKFTKPISWDYSTDDEILEIIGGVVGQDTLDGILANGSGYDMVATDGLGNSVMVGYENLAASNATNISEQDYIDITKSQLLQMGYTSRGTSSTILAGNNYLKHEMALTANGVTITQAYYVRKIGDYMSFIIVTATDKSIASIEAMF